MDNTIISVMVPDSFLAVCRHFKEDPATVLRWFAGDASYHHEWSHGSDEREYAMLYFQRAYAAGMQKDEADEIFETLFRLRKLKTELGPEKFGHIYEQTMQQLKERQTQNNTANG